MKTTIFHKKHKESGAKMVQFAGFEMPIQYPKGILAEHNAVRTGVGVFDVSHMGEFEVRGKDALPFLQKITINDVSKLAEGKAQYSAMCRPDGGIVDDLLVYHMGDYYMMVVNGANIDKDFAWAKENTAGFDVDLQDKSDEFHLLAVQGPKSPDVLLKLTDAPLNDIPYYNFTQGKLAGVDMIISRTGYTGEVGFELYFKGDEETACRIWSEIFKAGEEFGIEAIGLGARDTLRLEKGYCLYGNDIDDKSNPLEAGLGWITKLAKGSFNGSEAIAKVKADGIQRKLVGFKVTGEKFIARPHYPIMAGGEQIGEVTSGNVSPALNVGIGLGYVKKEFSEPGTQIEISARGKTFPAEVVKFPFV